MPYTPPPPQATECVYTHLSQKISEEIYSYLDALQTMVAPTAIATDAHPKIDYLTLEVSEPSGRPIIPVIALGHIPQKVPP